MTNGRDPARRPSTQAITRLAIQRRISRRHFLAGTGAGLGAIALAGCAPTPAASTAAPTGGGGGDLGDTLTLATWPNYHDQEVLDTFTQDTGVAINVAVYGSTEEMEAKIRAGNSGIDVVVPSNYAIEGWVADSLIEPLDYAKLPNFKREDWNDRFMDQAFDPGNKYSIPKNWGTTGIAYRSSKVTEDVSTWKQFFELAGTTYAGRSLIVDHQISSFGSAAVAMGYSLNTIDSAEMAEVEAMLTALKPKLFAISSDVQPPLRNLDTWLSIAWTGDGVQVGRDNEDARYVVASDGGELWIDSFTVPADAPHKDAAYAFLDYILQPAQAAAETEFCLFPHANDKATELVIEEIRNDPVIYPSADSLAKLEYAVNATYNSPERAEAWARIKASA
ncbi:MAG: extracellular solute-binding protein [Chloroflexota bacterium]